MYDYDPTLLDAELFAELYEKYGSEVLRKRLDTPIHEELHIYADSEDPATLDEAEVEAVREELANVHRGLDLARRPPRELDRQLS